MNFLIKLKNAQTAYGRIYVAQEQVLRTSIKHLIDILQNCAGPSNSVPIFGMFLASFKVLTLIRNPFSFRKPHMQTKSEVICELCHHE